MPVEADVTYTQLEDGIKASFTAAAPKAIVVPQRVDGIEEGTNLDEVRSAQDNGRIHAWTFWISPLQRRLPTTHDYDLKGSQKQLRMDVTYTFIVKFFYEYKDGTDTQNSMREANQAWIDVARYLSARPRFSLANRNLRQHFELQRESLALVDCKDCKCFIGVGSIQVLCYEHFTVL